MAVGSNILGAVVGGLSESFSMLLGFRYLLLLAIAFYLFSALFGLPRGQAGKLIVRRQASKIDVL
jgi:hypothetical protein